MDCTGISRIIMSSTSNSLGESDVGELQLRSQVALISLFYSVHLISSLSMGIRGKKRREDKKGSNLRRSVTPPDQVIRQDKTSAIYMYIEMRK